MRTTLADILSDNGFVVKTAENGLSAVEMCQQEPYDVVLMDVRMPGIDGVEAFRRIRETLDDVHVILMSAYGEDDLKHQALQEGAMAFLDKPLNLDTVIQLIAGAPGLSVLSITDDVDLSTLLRSYLESDGQRLTIVDSPDEALKLVEQVHFDVVLIDAEVPTATCLDAYLAIKDVSPTITAVIVSTADRELLDVAEEAVRRTAYTIITKPLDREAFTSVINQLRSQHVSGSVRKPDINTP